MYWRRRGKVSPIPFQVSHCSVAKTQHMFAEERGAARVPNVCGEWLRRGRPLATTSPPTHNQLSSEISHVLSIKHLIFISGTVLWVQSGGGEPSRLVAGGFYCWGALRRGLHFYSK